MLGLTTRLKFRGDTALAASTYGRVKWQSVGDEKGQNSVKEMNDEMTK